MKNVIIIGASSGIGRALAIRLLKSNCKVFITGRRKALLEEIQNEFPDRCLIKSFDINEELKIKEHFDEMVGTLETVDLIIANAGYGEINKNLVWESERGIIQTNVLGIARIYQLTYTLFVKQGYGHLVGISSIAAIRGNRHAPAYSATKAFQANYLEGLRANFKHLNKPIYVTDIQPGFVKTKMARGSGLFWVAALDTAADQIIKAIDRKKSIAFITRRWRLIAWLMKWLPRWIYDKI